MKKILSIMFILLSAFLLSCGGNNENEKIVTSFFVTSHFTEVCMKGIDNIEIYTLATSEPHEFELTSKDINAMNNSKVIILNGLELEVFESELTGSLKEKVRYATKSIEGEKRNNKIDPHAWLSIKYAKTYVTNIASFLVEAYPQYKETIETNRNAYLESLTELDSYASTKLSNLTSNIMIAAHEAFDYFAHDYNLEVKSVLGLEEEEPDAKKLANIIDFAKEHNVKTIFTEKDEEIELSNRIASEINAKVEELYTLEVNSNISYLDAIRYNIDIIAESLNG